MTGSYHSTTDAPNAASVFKVFSARNPISDAHTDHSALSSLDASNAQAIQVFTSITELKKTANKHGEMLPAAVDPGTSPAQYDLGPAPLPERFRSLADYVPFVPTGEVSGPITLLEPPPISASPPAQLAVRNGYSNDVPEDASPCLPPTPPEEAQRMPLESMPKRLSFPCSTPCAAPVCTAFRFDTSDVIDAMTKDPEALSCSQNLDISDTSRMDPSIMITALITALGLLSSHSSNPKVAVFQLSAGVVSVTLIALHTFHSKRETNTPSTFVHLLLKHFPLLIFASCWILFLLSIMFVSPKAMTVTISLVVLASIPMVCGARLPAAVTLAIITLFSLTFLTLVFLVCILPTEWLG